MMKKTFLPADSLSAAQQMHMGRICISVPIRYLKHPQTSHTSVAGNAYFLCCTYLEVVFVPQTQSYSYVSGSHKSKYSYFNTRFIH